MPLPYTHHVLPRQAQLSDHTDEARVRLLLQQAALGGFLYRAKELTAYTHAKTLKATPVAYPALINAS